MAIKINWQDLQKRIINWQEVEKVMLNWVQIWPEATPPVTDDYLCFTAEAPNSSIKLTMWWFNYHNFEKSYDWVNWTDYNYVWQGYETIDLNNVWDKVYIRNKSETVIDIQYSFYHFRATWKIAASWDVWYFLCKHSIDTLFEWCFSWLFSGCVWLTSTPSFKRDTLASMCYEGMFSWCTSLKRIAPLNATTLASSCYWNMFSWCTSLETPPELPATNLAEMCYEDMFYWCTSLSSLPSLPATTLKRDCYYGMFEECTNIKLSTVQVDDYQIEYRIPSEWIWTAEYQSTYRMFMYTWWTFTGDPSVNTTYYISNTRPLSPWIYYNATSGVISLSADSVNWIAIADKNLWATAVYNYWDTLSEANCGYYYQRWNNYGFPRTSATNRSSTQVDVSGYGPDNYYSSSTFITAIPIYSTTSYNLWWDTTGTNESRRWPCTSWYHIPSWPELENLIKALASLWITSKQWLSQYLLTPLAWYLQQSGGKVYSNQYTYWFSTTLKNYRYAYGMEVTDSPINYIGVYNWCGFSIRPFANSPVVPDSTRTVLYQLR